MGLWERLTGRFRLRGVLAKPTSEPGGEPQPPPKPRPTPTGRPLRRPDPTPTTKNPEVEGRTAGTPAYDSPKGTPSTRRIHNPTHFR